MRMEDQAPVIGAAFVGGMAQSYLIQRRPDWSWMLSVAFIGGGIYLGTRSGWMETIGLGMATAGAAGLGTSLVPVGGAGRVVRREIGAVGRSALPMGTGVRTAPEYQRLRLY